jgi:polar amino acid transport system permease protein
MKQDTFDWNVVVVAFPSLFDGLMTTLQLTAIVIGLSMLLAVPLAFARISHIDAIRWAAMVYIEMFRCTPLLIQLFWVYYALPILTDVTLPGFTSAVIALTLNLTAFMAEAYRTGIQSVPSDQIEAARMLQLNGFQRARYIVLPQAIQTQLPTILSLNISLFKETALVATIAVPDLMFVTNTHVAESYRSLELLTVAAVLYFAVAFPVSLTVNWIEQRTAHGNHSEFAWRHVLKMMLPGSRPGRPIRETVDSESKEPTK